MLKRELWPFPLRQCCDAAKALSSAVMAVMHKHLALSARLA